MKAKQVIKKSENRTGQSENRNSVFFLLFFNEMLTLMPADMAQDEEVKKVLGSLKGKVK